MKKQPQKKRFIVRKYIFAKSAQEALRKERCHRPDEVFLDDDWMKQNGRDLSSAMGFDLPKPYEDE